MVFEKVKTILADYKEIDESSIELDTTMESLGIDSLDTVELVMNLEDEFDVEIEVDEDIKTVGDLVKIIEGLL
ncbi:MAG: acyl carrier protein [Clostridiales bacterium]|nr:acyl carrier protein [Clostridiales bacterium]